MLWAFDSSTQSFVFGPKFGPTVAIQKWDNFDRQPLLTGHAALFVESYAEEESSSIFAQLGYYTRGSGVRQFRFTGFNTVQKYRFNNISLWLGAKRIINNNMDVKPYYIVGVRGEYTVSTNLKDFENLSFGINPVDEYVNKWNYGIMVGGGFQMAISEFVGAQIELVVNPDLSKQYFQPPIPNVITSQGQTITLSERSIRNVSIELSVGLRLLRKVEYYD